MTAAHTESGEHSGVGAPELCRVTVLARHTEVDLALPLGVPVALLMPGIVDLIAAHRPDNDFDTTPEHAEPDTWTLGRIGQASLAGALSLEEHGVRDGELLVLGEAAAPAPPPLFDDVMYNVAVAGRDRMRRWSAHTAALAGSVIAFLSIVAGCASLLTLDPGDGRLWAGAAAAGLAVLLVGAAAVVARAYGDRSSAVLPAVCAEPAAFAAGMLFVPGEFAAPHLLLGSVLVGACAVIAMRVTLVGTATFTAIAATSAVATIAFTVAASTELDVPALGAGVIVTALLLSTVAPRVATALAGVPLPPVPAPGTSLDPVVSDPDDESPLPSFEELEAQAARARSYLTGFVYAVVVLAVAGAWCAAWPPAQGGTSWPGIALAVSTAVVLMFRGRTFTGAEKAAPLVVGGALVPVGLIAVAAAAGSLPVQLLFGLSLTLFLVAILLGVVAPGRSFTPVQRRIAELTEYAVIATLVPLACWVAGLYSAVRGL
ncbi:type VII secretion integral membrane protein EccD [Rhodococcus chondri]|uniref:Type VII secretion integral membrane protein EccD n=1 Tax=Rhodococcus chondri TaxID=3065941 RepID=A0ABU7JW31_9NOCA|nr:type VII secretion integral membrane protein EccD [Rhodococcus sp. CC-R104]MEE2034234.1 type VII secretion integral membrane protein EccD [Rhodococcus sp. CC-R104]